MGQQPHAFEFAEKLKIRLAQPHPGADDVERQVAFDEIGQDLGQVLGEWASRSPGSHPTPPPGPARGREW